MFRHILCAKASAAGAIADRVSWVQGATKQVVSVRSVSLGLIVSDPMLSLRRPSPTWCNAVRMGTAAPNVSCDRVPNIADRAWAGEHTANVTA